VRWPDGRQSHNFFAPVDPGAKPWVGEHALAVLQGTAEDAADALEQHADAAQLSEHKRVGADKAVGYLRAKPPYLSYGITLAEGWPIATGVIEGACRHLIKGRMGITGARWGLTGAEAPSSSSARACAPASWCGKDVRRTVVILDCCFSGQALDGEKGGEGILSPGQLPDVVARETKLPGASRWPAAQRTPRSAIAEEIGNDLGQLNALNGLARAAMSQADLGTAAGHYRRALALAEELSNDTGRANAHIGLGNIGRRRDEPLTAEQHFLQALASARAVDNRPAQATILRTLGDLTGTAHYYTQAAALTDGTPAGQ
jgi:tetratricopeptide (TPR) repeat protein